MALSVAAKLYLTWQVYDLVNRSPTRIVHLDEEIPGLVAWPDFRQAVMEDPRFLVVDDFLDVATAGIPGESPVAQVVTATLDRVRMPMRDQDLVRIVHRLRPAVVGSDVIAQGLREGDLYRPRTGHVARRRWLVGARPVELPPDLPRDPLRAAESYLARQSRVSAAGLAAALSERYGLTITEAYAVAVDPVFLPLPDGTVCLYLPVEDEITDATEAAQHVALDVEISDRPESVALGDIDEHAPIPADLVARAIRYCRESGDPIRTVVAVPILWGLRQPTHAI
jgi:hypothetical protein